MKKQLDMGALENVAGGLAIHGIVAGTPTATPTTPSLIAPTSGVQPFMPFGVDPNFGGGGYGFEGYGGFGGHGGHHMGHQALREFTHDATFQNALAQFETQHPELAASFAPLQQGQHHGLWQVMHDPNGRAALDQFFHDQSFASAYQQFATTHPELAQPLAHTIMRTEARIEGGYGGYPGYGVAQPFGGVQPTFDPYGQPTGTATSGVGIDPASIGLPSTF